MKKMGVLIASILTITSLIVSSPEKAVAIEDNQTVSIDKTWHIKFNQQLNFDVTSKSGIVIKDSNGNIIPVTLQLDEYGKTVLVSPPTDGYKPGEKYTLDLNNNIKSVEGKNLKDNIKMNFSIASGVQEEIILGNTAGNSVNGGLAAETDKYIYFLYSEFHEPTNIYRTDKNNKNIEKLNKDKISASNISVIDDAIYYQRQVANPDYDFWTNDNVNKYIADLYKLESNGTTSTKLLSSIDQYIVTSKGIYYLNAEDDYKLYKSDLDGSHKVKLLNDSISCFNISGQNIVYSRREKADKKVSSIIYSGQIYKADLDGSNLTLLTKNMGYSLNTVDNYVYYINQSDNNKIYKISLDAKENIKIFDDSAETINVHDGWIYYCNDSKPKKLHIPYSPEGSFVSYGTLYKVKIDGTDAQSLSDHYSYRLNTVSNKIYYYEYFDSGVMSGDIHRSINKDGSNSIRLFEFMENIN